jgi:hypothetical protein
MKRNKIPQWHESSAKILTEVNVPFNNKGKNSFVTEKGKNLPITVGRRIHSQHCNFKLFELEL